jgi:type II secretion system protein N
MGGDFDVQHGSGKISGSASVSMKGQSVDFSFKASRMDLAKLAPLFNVKLSGTVNGAGNLSGDFSQPSSLSGAVDLQLDRLALEPQTIAGFAIPRIAVSSGKAVLQIDKGKAQVKTLTLGKAGGSDDIVANASGDVTLGRQIESSTLNLRTTFSLSKSVIDAFVILDAILAPGKRPDGSYGFALTGTMSAPNSAPLPGGA